MAVAREAAPRIGSLLLEAARRHPDSPAVGWDEAQLDYAGLSAAADRLAEHMLTAAGTAGGHAGHDLRGARVAVIAPNSPALVVALFAAAWLQAVAVPLSARLREHEVSRMLEDAEPTIILSVPAHLGFSFVDLLTRIVPGLPTVRSVLFLGPLGQIEQEVAGSGTGDTEPVPSEVGAILYTSGTTGVPQGALVTHAREVQAACELASILSLGAGECTALVVPIAHAFGLTCLLATIASGGCAVLVQSTFSPRSLLEAVVTRGVSVLHGSPALFASVLSTRPEGVPGVRGYVAGSSPPPGLLARLDGVGMSILNLYGLTETGAVSCCRPEDPPHCRYESSGRPLTGFELRIREPNDPHDRLGELEVRGPAVMPGYYRRPDETAAAFTEDGWLVTGDLATIEDGYLYVRGRAKELVNVGGFNVFPAEVEAVLLEHPDVVQAAVVGVPDERLGEVLRAFVVPRAGSDLTPAALLSFARDRVAGYKLPYSTRIVEELPLLASGKPDRRALASADAETGT